MSGDGLLPLLVFAVYGPPILFVYALPSLIAIVSGNPNRREEVLVLNLLFGWTVVGWVVALRLAVSRKK
jgi:hypothetical protein